MINFSIILNSIEHVDLFDNFLESLMLCTNDMSNIEVLVGANIDISSLCNKYAFVSFYKGCNKNYFNWIFKFATGRFIVVCDEHVEIKTKDWDKISIDVLNNYLKDKSNDIVYGIIEDGSENHFPLISRKAIETVGWVLPTNYSVDTIRQIYNEIGRVCHIPVLFNSNKTVEPQVIENYDIKDDVNRLYNYMNNNLPIGKNGVIYSILVATRERPDLLESFIESVEKNTICKKSVEICVAYDLDDNQTCSKINKIQRRFGSFVKFYGRQRTNMINRDYFNWLYRFSHGSFLIVCDDDCLMMTDGWDQLLTSKLNVYLKDKPDGVIYGKINDGCYAKYTKFPLISRKSVDTVDYLINSDFSINDGKIHLERLYSFVNRNLNLDDIVIDHISYKTGKRDKDGVNYNVEKGSLRMTNDPNGVDITSDVNKINNFINLPSSVSVVNKKPNILFVTEKWCDGNPQAGVTNSHHNLFGSLNVSGIAEYTCLHFDEYFIKYGRNLDEELIKYCADNKPDVIVSTYLCHPAHLNIKQETWVKIRNMKIPIVFIWFDLVVPFVADIANSLCFDLNVGLDIFDFKSKYPDKFLPMWTPQDTRHYFNPRSVRDIDVCFLGSISGYNDRITAIETLRGNGVDVMQMGGQREQPLPLESYVSVMQRAKITLSFPRYRSAPHLVQAKGRIFEATFCGSLLMDAENVQTKHWFSPGDNFVSFADNQDLLNKVKYYLKNEEERSMIAESGWLRSTKMYSAKNFWQTILGKVGAI